MTSNDELAELRAEVERLRDVCSDWGSNYQSWVDAKQGADSRAEAAEAKVARVEALAVEWLTTAEAETGDCPDGSCGTCTQGNLAQLIRAALDGDA